MKHISITQAFNYLYTSSRYQLQRADGLIVVRTIVYTYNAGTVGLEPAWERMGSRVYSSIWVCVALYR